MYDFIIVARGVDPAADDFEANFLDAGCDDATLAVQRGCIIADFSRRSGTAEDAIESAVQNVRSAGASILRVEPDPLVTMSDIADRMGITRAAVSYYAKGERGAGFPSPVARITSESPLWRWSEVIQWFASSESKDFEAEVRFATAVERANEKISS